ncbi:MAG: hypothetical protein H6620_05690 [Halobacteriovoraceae bacterium]|nr:hypothetical protein [Halobacteriovoraceae bacterium]
MFQKIIMTALLLGSLNSWACEISLSLRSTQGFSEEKIFEVAKKEFSKIGCVLTKNSITPSLNVIFNTGYLNSEYQNTRENGVFIHANLQNTPINPSIFSLVNVEILKLDEKYSEKKLEKKKSKALKKLFKTYAKKLQKSSDYANYLKI